MKDSVKDVVKLELGYRDREVVDGWMTNLPIANGEVASS